MTVKTKTIGLLRGVRPFMIRTFAAGAVLVFAAARIVDAAEVNATATVTIQNESGSVGGGETPTPTPAPTIVTTPPPDTSLVDGGGATSEAAAVEQAGVTTFRPVPAAAAPVAEPAFTPAAADGASGGATENTGPRLPRGAQPVGNLVGGMSAVAVTGAPNQHYGISLPGETVFIQGPQTMNIEGFVHNAGDTPAMNTLGRAMFNVGAKVAPAGQSTGGAPAGGGAGAAGGPTYQGPVITTNPFMDVIISYN